MHSEEVFKKIVKLYHEHKLAHAYLFETNNIDDCYNDLLTAIKAILCKETYEEKCEKCNICHLIDNDSLPCLITIEPENNTIKKEAIENMKIAFANLPLYTGENIYIIKRPECMNNTAYNRLLKFLEEPEDNIISFFITEAKDKIAPTIVSRLELIKVIYQSKSAEENNKYDQLANAYIEKIDLGYQEAIWYNYNVLLKELPERSEIVLFFNQLLNIYTQKRKYQKMKILANYLKRLDYNVNIPLLLDSFVIEMGQKNEI